MHVMIDLDAIARVIALIGGPFLFVLWVLVSRKLVGFLLVLAGEVTLVVVVLGEHQPVQMIGAVLAAGLIAALLIVGTIVARARARRFRFAHTTPAQLRAAALAERNTPEISAHWPAHRSSGRTPGDAITVGQRTHAKRRTLVRR